MSESANMMHPVPDDNTMEIAEYGPKYMDVKSSLYISDLMIDFLNIEARSEYEQLDLDVAEFILIHRPYWLNQEVPHAETIEQMTAVRRLKIILQDLSAIEEIELTKAETKQFGMMSSAEEYGKRLVERGMDTELFRAMSIENADRPLNFESIRKIRDHDMEKRSAEEEYEYKLYLKYLREAEARENERIRIARERGIELVDVPDPEVDGEQEPDAEEEWDEDYIPGEIRPEVEEWVTDPEDELPDLAEPELAFLENIIMCDIDLTGDETEERVETEEQTECTENGTEETFGNGEQAECSENNTEAMFGNEEQTECSENETEERFWNEEQTECTENDTEAMFGNGEQTECTENEAEERFWNEEQAECIENDTEATLVFDDEPEDEKPSIKERILDLFRRHRNGD
jgi:hypothetical protein